MAGGGEDKSSKKHPATEHKKKQSKKKGNVAKSQDVTMAFGLLAGFGMIFALKKFYYNNMLLTMQECISWIEDPNRLETDLVSMAFFVLKQVAILSLPVLFAVMTVAFVAQLGMVGFILTGEQLKPKMDKINPMKGIKRWFAIKSMVELGKSLAKIVVTFGIGILAWRGVQDKIAESVLLEKEQILILGGQIIASLFWKIIVLYIVIAVLDYMFQKWQWLRDLKMSDKELRDEFKEQEGDPYQKAQRRQMAQEIAFRQSAEENVPQADAVVINPTELAIALKYDPDLSPVPFVIAKGEQRLADDIRESARKAGVPVVRNKPLARGLYEACEIGDIVPADLYRPVAEVLAYVFSLREQQEAMEAGMAAEQVQPGAPDHGAAAAAATAGAHLPH